MGKRVTFWYTHKAVHAKLVIATVLAHTIVTASPESFLLTSKKCHVVGHGIDTERFKKIQHVNDHEFRIVTIGRISRSKGYHVLFDALEFLRLRRSNFRATIIGGAITKEDESYSKEIDREVIRRNLVGIVTLRGAVPNRNIDEYLARADLFVNMSETGSLDKAVLEAMAACVPVLTSNVGLESTLKGTEAITMFPPGDSEAFAMKIEQMMSLSLVGRSQLGLSLQNVVLKKHSLQELVPRIYSLL
jgi:glycosyltransferase involved in cell wall biosynthesis